jgi:hypothetical protein
MGFEPTISPFERAKTVHALDRAATEHGNEFSAPINILEFIVWLSYYLRLEKNSAPSS